MTTPERRSGRQNPRPEQVEARPSVPLALQQLQLVDEPFHRPVAPRLREPRPDRCQILPEYRSETRTLGDECGPVQALTVDIATGHAIRNRTR